MRLRTQPDAPLLTQAAGIPLRAVKYAATRSSFFSVLKLDQLKEIIFYLDIEAFRNLTLTCLALLRLRTSSVFLGDSLQFYYPRPRFFSQLTVALPAEPQYPPTSILFLESGYLVMGNSSLDIFDLTNGSLLYNSGSRFHCKIASNRDNTLVAAVIGDATNRCVIGFNTHAREVRFIIENRDVQKTCALSSTGTYVFYAVITTIYKYNIANNTLVRLYVSHRFSPIDDLIASPDDQWIVSTHSNHIDSPRAMFTSLVEDKQFSLLHPATIVSAKFSPDALHFIAALKNGQIWVWDIQKRECISRFSVGEKRINDISIIQRADGGVWIAAVAEKKCGHYYNFVSMLEKNEDVAKKAQAIRAALEEPTLYVWDIQKGISILQYSMIDDRKGLASLLSLSDLELCQKIAEPPELLKFLNNTPTAVATQGDLMLVGFPAHVKRYQLSALVKKNEPEQTSQSAAGMSMA